jgi:hypothetical protein
MYQPVVCSVDVGAAFKEKMRCFVIAFQSRPAYVVFLSALFCVSMQSHFVGHKHNHTASTWCEEFMELRLGVCANITKKSFKQGFDVHISGKYKTLADVAAACSKKAFLLAWDSYFVSIFPFKMSCTGRALVSVQVQGCINKYV